MSERIVYIGLIVVLSLILYVHTKKQNEVIDTFRSIVDTKNAEIEYHLNEKGRIIAEKQAAEMRYRDLQKAYPSIHNSIKKDLDLKIKNLKAYIQSEFQVASTKTGTVTILHYDSANHSQPDSAYRVLNINDGYLKLTSYIGDGSESNYSYTYTDTIKQAISFKRKWFLGKQQLYGTATMSNPSSTIKSSSSVLIKDFRDKRFGVGVGANYNPFTNKINIGIGVQYNLIKF